MKRSRRGLWLLCFLALLLTSVAQAMEDAPGLLAQAERSYRAGEYKSAAQSWQRYLSEQEDGDARVEYNLGNCAFRLGEYAVAIWRYERAARVLRSSEELSFNLGLARQRLGIGPDESQGLLGQLRDEFAQWRSGDWLWLGLTCEVLGLLLMTVALLRRKPGLLIFGLLLALVGSAALYSARGLDEAQRGGTQSHAIVFGDRTPIFAEPRDALEPKARLGAGVSVRVLEATPAWLRVEGRGVRGWVARDRLGLY
ncbi:MAG: hypothetical protein CSA62_05475 [Planctomycetota bacterium]|nr:MAG: hypothetical protein CSA62_05475 [Planctomycetota bacterium]